MVKCLILFWKSWQGLNIINLSYLRGPGTSFQSSELHKKHGLTWPNFDFDTTFGSREITKS